MEQHPYWQTWLDTATVNGDWAITDLYQATLPQELQNAFLKTPLRGVLIIELQYRQQRLGYLSIFRPEIGHCIERSLSLAEVKNDLSE